MVEEVMAAITTTTSVAVAATTVTNWFHKRKPSKEMRFSRFHISRKSSSSSWLPSVTNENGASKKTHEIQSHFYCFDIYEFVSYILAESTYYSIEYFRFVIFVSDFGFSSTHTIRSRTSTFLSLSFGIVLLLFCIVCLAMPCAMCYVWTYRVHSITARLNSYSMEIFTLFIYSEWNRRKKGRNRTKEMTTTTTAARIKR